jgi:hypothetical protein
MQTPLLRFASAALLLSLAQVGFTDSPAGVPDAAAANAAGTVTLVVAASGRPVDMRVDGHALHRAARVGDVIGPVRLPAGRHVFAFVGPGGGAAQASVELRPGSSLDVVLHRPAAVRGASVVSAFRTPVQSIKAGRSRIVVAATASLVPADVLIDHRVVTDNIANGESVSVEVAAGRHRVALVPTGQVGPAVVGPLDVNVAAGTVTMIYAAGGPPVGGLRTILHTVAMGGGGEAAPGRLHTGSAGLARDLSVREFGPG